MSSIGPQKSRKTRQWHKHQVLALLLGLLVMTVGCGKQAFVVTNTTTTFSAPGGYTIPAKVDVLLVEDDTGSMYEAYTPIARQLPPFLEGLEASGWDYHFATVPLTSLRDVSQIAASRYDSNWGAQWVPPYPGANPNAAGMSVSEALFSSASQYSDFLPYGYISNVQNGMEPGFKTIWSVLTDMKVKRGTAQDTGFLRNDALLAILVVGNGEDTSDVNYCQRSDNTGVYVPCSDGSATTSFNTYRDRFRGFKSSPSLVKFYSAVAFREADNCQGGRSRIGTRYRNMATALGGQSYDICRSNAVAQAVAGMSAHLQAQRQAYETRFLFLEEEPDLATPITVTVYRDGKHAQVIPQSESNGWTYAGYITDYAIDAPIALSLSTGYAIELHGTAKLIGDDTASIDFKPAGINNSSEE